VRSLRYVTRCVVPFTTGCCHTLCDRFVCRSIFVPYGALLRLYCAEFCATRSCVTAHTTFVYIYTLFLRFTLLRLLSFSARGAFTLRFTVALICVAALRFALRLPVTRFTTLRSIVLPLPVDRFTRTRFCRFPPRAFSFAFTQMRYVALLPRSRLIYRARCVFMRFAARSHGALPRSTVLPFAFARVYSRSHRILPTHGSFSVCVLQFAGWFVARTHRVTTLRLRAFTQVGCRCAARLLFFTHTGYTFGYGPYTAFDQSLLRILHAFYVDFTLDRFCRIRSLDYACVHFAFSLPLRVPAQCLRVTTWVRVTHVVRCPRSLHRAHCITTVTIVCSRCRVLCVGYTTVVLLPLPFYDHFTTRTYAVHTALYVLPIVTFVDVTAVLLFCTRYVCCVRCRCVTPLRCLRTFGLQLHTCAPHATR